jgi:predicted DNA-binding protein
MGRPPLHMTPTLVRFPEETLERIDKLVGDKQRAKFIREAVVNEIEHREKLTGDGKATQSSE